MLDHESGKVYMHAVGMARGCVCMGLFHVEYGRVVVDALGGLLCDRSS